MLETEQKQCNQCTKTKPLSAFYKQKNTPDRRMHHCIECYKANREEYQRQAPERERQWQEQVKAAEEESRRAWAEKLERESEERREEYSKQLDGWYETQTNQICARCKQRRSPRGFGTWQEELEWTGVWDANNPPELHRTCKECRYTQCCCHLSVKMYRFSDNLPRCQARLEDELSHIKWRSINFIALEAYFALQCLIFQLCAKLCLHKIMML